MATQSSGTTNGSNTKLLEELEALSQTLYQSHTASTTTRRTASLALPRESAPSISSLEDIKDVQPRPRSRRMSLSPWRSRPKLDDGFEQTDQPIVMGSEMKKLAENIAEPPTAKRGLWNWKPLRALSHIGMQKMSCLFSVEVVGVQGLPATMNGLRLSVCVRKKETKDGAVHTMPARVSQGAADFEETLFARCHVYCTSPPANAKRQQQQQKLQQLRFEPRPFLIYVFAMDAKELEFGKSAVDLSELIQESIEKNIRGQRVRQWDTIFDLSGKAKGGELVLRLGFQIMDKDGGIDIYSQAQTASSTGSSLSSSMGRRQSKSSFSIPSPKMKSRAEAWSSAGQAGATTPDLQGMDELDLDKPAAAPPAEKPHNKKPKEPESKTDDLEIVEFEVVDKGVEVDHQEKEKRDEFVEEGQKENAKEEEDAEEGSALSASEVVKSILHEHVHLTRLTELDSIAQQIKALESLMAREKIIKIVDEETESQRLDADEEIVTREFLQMLEYEKEGNKLKLYQPENAPLNQHNEQDKDPESNKVLLPDLGKNLGCVVQTKHGGYLVAMNPLDTAVGRKDAPKLAMQVTRPVVLSTEDSINGFEMFQMMTAMGLEELSNKILSVMPMDELMGKTPEQMAFEGIASAIISGREKEGASSSAARTLASVKTMAIAMSSGREERISTGIWNVSEDPVSADEILAFSMQKLEVAVVEALRIQADMAEEEAPFDVSSSVYGNANQNQPLATAVSLEDWMNDGGGLSMDGEKSITLSAVVQLRDPLRRFEAVGGPMIVLIQASPPAADCDMKPGAYDEEKRFKVASLHVGGITMRSVDKKGVMWSADKQRLTAIQWLVAYGLGKPGRKERNTKPKGPDLLWSISSRVMADMWLKPIRNPDVKFSR